MHPEAREELRVRFKVTILEYAKVIGVSKTCREFDVARSTFYEWKKRYETEGRSGLYRKKPIAHHHPRKHPNPPSTRSWNCAGRTNSVLCASCII